MNPSDPYIEEFVADINRARVLRTRSIMKPMTGEPKADAVEVNWDMNLEDTIAMVKGDTSKHFVVTKDGQNIGEFDMHDIMEAMVPRRAASA